MGRKKVRKHQSIAYYEAMLKDYFSEHKDDVVEYMLGNLGYDSLDDLWNDEYRMKFGFDCGWIYLIPRDKEMYHEWELDNGKYGAHIFCRTPYNTQSTTIQREQVEKAVHDLGLEDKFWISVRLD